MVDIEYYYKFEELRDRKIKAFVHEINNKYMFVNSKEDTIYCSHCKKTMSRSANKYYTVHNKEDICPNCRSEVITKYTGFSRKNLDSAKNIVVFQKGKHNEIFGNGYVAVTNFLDYKKPSIKVFKKAIYDLYDLSECVTISSNDFKKIHGGNLILGARALEKQVPAEPRHLEETYGTFCECGARTLPGQRYCSYCGQKLIVKLRRWKSNEDNR